MPSIEASNRAIPLPSAELNLGGTSTSEAQFLTASAQNGLAAATSLICYLPGTGVVSNRLCTLRAWGRFQTAVASTFAAKLYLGTSATIASNTNIATTGAIGSVAGAAVKTSWYLEVQMVIDSGGLMVTGLQKGWVHKTAVAQAIVTTTAALTSLTTEGQGFTVTGTFGTGTASNVAYCDGFELLTQ